MYTPAQQQFLDYVTQKVKTLFAEFPAPGHDFTHAEKVCGYAKEIATKENTENAFLCELAGVLHDIGRAPEHANPQNTLRHHELSYNLLREWFREDTRFDFLSDAEKLELLYAIRYHWNDFADEYSTAWILRDADKLDALGCRGLERFQQYRNHDEKGMNMDCMMTYYFWYWIRTDSARKIAQEKKLMEEMNAILKEKAQSNILSVEL